MKYEVVNIAQQYKEGNIDAEDAMDTILSILFPPVVEDYDYFIRRLIAFMWGIDLGELMNAETGRSGDLIVFKAKVTYTKIMSYTKNERGKYISRLQLAKKIGMNTHAGVGYRLAQHDIFYSTDPDYRKIYDIIKKAVL